MAVSRKVFNQLPSPYSKCNLQSIDSLAYDDYRNYLKLLNLEYQSSDCIIYCLREIIENYKCSLLNCSEQYLIDSYKICDLNCPLKCNSDGFNKQFSYKAFPSRAYYNNQTFSQFNESTDFDTFRESILRFKVGYESLYIAITNKKAKMNLEDLLSQIGGLLGCFLGASFISLVEIFELFVEIFSRIFNRKQKVEAK